MHRQIIFFLLFCFTSAFSQVSSGHSYCNNILINSFEKENSVFKKSFSVNIAPAVFIPVRYYSSNAIGTGLNIGLQYNYSEKHSLCLDFDLAFANRKYGNIVSEYETSYMQLEIGPKFFLQREEKLDIFAVIGFGVLFASDANSAYKRTNLPLCFSFEAGLNYKLTKNLSALFKIKNNIGIIATIYNFDLNDFLLFNSGLSWQF